MEVKCNDGRLFKGPVDSIEAREAMDGDVKYIEVTMDEEYTNGEEVWLSLDLKEGLKLAKELVQTFA